MLYKVIVYEIYVQSIRICRKWRYRFITINVFVRIRIVYHRQYWIPRKVEYSTIRVKLLRSRPNRIPISAALVCRRGFLRLEVTGHSHRDLVRPSNLVYEKRVKNENLPYRFSPYSAAHRRRLSFRFMYVSTDLNVYARLRVTGGIVKICRRSFAES